uniref:GATOR complex protein NPRL3 n=1 Tax=Plectus sambesii TaxID=2011161 RepID=A0A914WBV3_9BILA
MVSKPSDSLSPLGVVFVSKGANAEQLLFMYPFDTNEPHRYETTTYSTPYSVYSVPKGYLEPPTLIASHNRLHQDQEGEGDHVHGFGISESMMAHLFTVNKEIANQPFEIKIDAIRYAGFPLLLSKRLNEAQPSSSATDGNLPRPDLFNIVFVLKASVSRSIVASYQALSKRLALAIDHEESRCRYMSRQTQIMLQAHDEIRALPEGHSESAYRLILTKSELARQLKHVYNDIREYGFISLHINDWVEVSFCLQQKALQRVGIPSTSLEKLESALQYLRPYHGILVLEDVPLSIDASPTIVQLLRYCTPSKSLQDICSDADLPLSQVFLVVRHLITWCKAVVIYPLCETNLYAVAPDAALSKQLIEQFSETTPNHQLSTVLAEFSPPVTLLDFTNPMLHEMEEQVVRRRIVVWALRHHLLVQLHTYLYILPPLSTSARLCDAPASERNMRIENRLKESKLDAAVVESLSDICHMKRDAVTPEALYEDLQFFLRLTKYFDGEHHIEDIMYSENCNRSSLLRILDAFEAVLVTSIRQDSFSCAIRSRKRLDMPNSS